MSTRVRACRDDAHAAGVTGRRPSPSALPLLCMQAPTVRGRDWRPGDRGCRRGPTAALHRTRPRVHPRRCSVGGVRVAPPVGFEPTLPPPEGGALSPELRGPRWDDHTAAGGARNRRDPEPTAIRRRKWVGRRAPAPIPLAGDPRAALRPRSSTPWRPSSAEGAITLPGGVPATVTVERPRQKGHGDYATNVALQLAKQAGPPPARPRDAARRAARRPPRASRRSRSPGPGFLNITVDGRRPGRGRRRRSSPPGAAYGGSERVGGGEKVNLEFVSANPTGPIHLGGARWAAVGDALGADVRGDRAPRSPGSTTSTTTAPRSTGSAARCSPRARASRRPRTATAAQYIAEIAARGRRRAPRRARPARRRGAGGRSARSASSMMFDEIKADPARLRRATSTSTSTRTTCTSRAPSTARSRGSRELGQHLRAGRRALARAPRSTATTRTA